jgi:hypothetical protein
MLRRVLLLVQRVLRCCRLRSAPGSWVWRGCSWWHAANSARGLRCSGGRQATGSHPASLHTLTGEYAHCSQANATKPTCCNALVEAAAEAAWAESPPRA